MKNKMSERRTLLRTETSALYTKLLNDQISRLSDNLQLFFILNRIT